MAEPDSVITLEAGQVDLQLACLRGASGPVPLTARECRLLEYLSERPGEVVDREILHREVWGQSEQVVSRAVDSTMSRLRSKVELDSRRPRHLITVHGEGYRFVPLQRVTGVKPDPVPGPVHAGDLVLDLAAATITNSDGIERLTAVECRLLEFLLARPGTLVDRPTLLRRCWDGEGSPRALHNALHRLRAKLGGDQLQSVRGRGVRLVLELNPQTNLTEPVHPLLGRQTELARLDELCRECTLVTLLGTAGVGKTRLATQLAWQQRSQWPGGVWFVPVAPAHDVLGMCRQVAATLQVPLRDADPVAALTRVLTGRGPLLLVLDNLEQLGEQAGDAVEQWTSTGSGATCLVTSREPLRLDHEHRLTLRPLPQADAEALFVTRAQQLQATQGSHDPAAVTALVHGLDCLPLAIELAAARTSVLSVGQILEHLDARFELLRGHGSRPALESSLASSWELLTPPEQRAWAQLSVFESSFDVEAAAAVVDDPNPLSTLDLLQSFVEKHLITVSPGPSEVTYSMLQSLQAFGGARLTELGEEARAHRRHVLWHAQLGSDEVLDNLYGPQSDAWFAKARRAYPDLVAAVRRGQELGLPDPAARCAVVAILARNNTGVQQELAALGEQADVSGLRDGTSAWLWVARARCLKDTGYRAEATTFAKKALAAAASPACAIFAAVVHSNCGLAMDSTAAIAVGRRAVQMARDQGHAGWIAWALGRLGSALYYSGDAEQAESAWEEAAQLFRSVGDEKRALGMLGHQANLLLSLGANAAAQAAYEEALENIQEPNRQIDRATLMGNLANLHAGEGRLREARALYRSAIRLQRQAGQDDAAGITYTNWAYALALHDEDAEARRMLQYALGLLDPSNRMARGHTLTTLADLERKAGALGRSRQHLAEARRLLGDKSFAFARIFTLCASSQLATAEGDHEAAQRWLEDAEALAEQCGVEPESASQARIDTARRALRAVEDGLQTTP